MRAVTPFTLVMAYYRNLGMLGHYYDMWRTWDQNVLEHMHVIVVDDGTPIDIGAGPPFEPIPGLRLQIWRMLKDVRWNQDACRNLGVDHAETNWVLLTDMDHMVREETAAYLIGREWDPAMAYKFRRVSAPDLEPYKPHPNSWFMTKKLFDATGGYDERFAGLYGTDGDFRDRLRPLIEGGEFTMLKQALVRVPRQVISDASTTHYLRKQPEDRDGLARVYAERAAIPDWVPLRGTQEHIRIYP